MEAVVRYFNSLGLDFHTFWKAALVLLVGSLLLSIIGKVAFKKRSSLNHAISSSIGILFMYALVVVLKSAGAQFQSWVAPMPLADITDTQLVLFSFQGSHYTVICSEIFSMIVLAFLVNLTDSLLPKGKNIFTWFIFRCLTVALSYALHLVVVWLFSKYLPENIAVYTPVILLCILLLLLLTGFLKILVGAVLTTVNPIIGGLYAFFFATAVGKQLSKSVLTTGILCVLVLVLRYLGIVAITITSAALMAYIPFLIILLVLWFFTFKTA